MADLKPRYEVHKLPGTTTRTFTNIKEGGGFEQEEKEVDAGYMVYFPSGASIRCWDDAHLAQLEFDRPPTLVDMETGDDHGPSQMGSLKSRSEQKTSKGRERLPALGGNV
jgi:hypothetical protein